MQETEMRLPAVALRGMTILPEMITHFDVSRARSVKAVEKALTQEYPSFDKSRFIISFILLSSSTIRMLFIGCFPLQCFLFLILYPILFLGTMHFPECNGMFCLS